MSMKGIYDHQKLIFHKRVAIPLNIKLGEAMNEILKTVDERLLKEAVVSLKREYQEAHDDILNTPEKKNHIQQVLDKIGSGKYNFVKQNIEEGQKFNEFYKEAEIPLPTQQRNFKCQYCEERYFKTNASLYSHYRSCLKKKQEEQSIQQDHPEKKQGFRPVRNKNLKESEPKERKLLSVIRVDNGQIKDENPEKLKRQKPVSSFSFGSDIFYGDE